MSANVQKQIKFELEGDRIEMRYGREQLKTDIESALKIFESYYAWEICKSKKVTIFY
jgi:hypothetical protein